MSYRLADLLRDVQMWRLTPEQARQNLLEIRNIIDGLLTTHSDVQRLRLLARFKNRLTLGWSRPENLAIWSKIADAPPADPPTPGPVA